jgi:hypothetical protein
MWIATLSPSPVLPIKQAQNKPQHPPTQLAELQNPLAWQRLLSSYRGFIGTGGLPDFGFL